jgi:hypothetical protein
MTWVILNYTRYEVAQHSNKLSSMKNTEQYCMEAVTGADGHFELSPLFPGQDFKLFFQTGENRYWPNIEDAPKCKIEKHGDTLKLGDIKLPPR